MSSINLTWSHWVPLYKSWSNTEIPASPGLYRIRQQNSPLIDYIGQTGEGSMNLRLRLGMLRGVYTSTMPYRDPHTAAPALWAIRQETNHDFEVSVMSVDGTTFWRKGLECLAISLYRQEQNCSPTVNFGRISEKYRMPGYRAQSDLANIGDKTSNHQIGIKPYGPLTGTIETLDWCGHLWTPWTHVAECRNKISRSLAGLYRIRFKEHGILTYIGEGYIIDRLTAHLKKAFISSHSQREFFALEGLECSWTVNDTWLRHQRLELENDLIAAHILATNKVPIAQFKRVESLAVYAILAETVSSMKL